MIASLITLIYIIILAVLWWLASYVLDNFPLPPPADRIVRVAVTIIVAIAAIYILLGVFGVSGVSGVPRLRFG
jgi:hypothetical protein